MLIVEDEWLIRMEIADAFEGAGWTVLEANSGEEAMTMLSAEVSLVVTDIRLAGTLSGWDVAEQWRTVSPGIPVIYASANPPDDTRRVRNSVFLKKPIRTRELLAHAEAMRGQSV